MAQPLVHPDRQIAKLDDLRRQGQRLRAYELALGWTRQFAYEPRVWAAIGDLALELGHDVEAGRALFWSGVRSDAARPAIAKYLAHLSHDPNRLLSSVPTAVWRSLEEYPPSLQFDLRALGWRPAHEHRVARVTQGRPPRSRLRRCLVSLAMVALGVCFIAGAISATAHGARLTWQFVFG